jgi:hypothetical protein
MRTERKKSTPRPTIARKSADRVRIEIVDPAHARWAAVLKLISRLGDRPALLLDEDGWLSARQSVLAAFVNDKPAAYLVFHVHPVGDGKVEAHLDAMRFISEAARSLTEKKLSDAALRQCKRLKCIRFKGLKIRAGR